MKDFYVKKREKDMKFLIMLFDVTFYIYQSFFILQKTKNIIFTSCNFSYYHEIIVSFDKHTQFFKYINVFPDIFNIPEAWRFTVVIFYIGDTG